VWIQPAVQGGHFDDVHGAGWRLCTVDTETDALDEGALQWFDSIGGRVIRLHTPDPLAHRWLAEHDATYVLQRPDFHLYGTATTASGASALVADLRSRLSATHCSLKGVSS
jgi:flavoprotein hydroxylase